MYSHWKFSLVLLLAASTSARFDHHHVYHEVDVVDTTEGNGGSDVWSREEKVRITSLGRPVGCARFIE